MSNDFISMLSKCEGKHVVLASENQNIFFEEKNDAYVYIVESGTVDVKRKNDNIIILTTKGPAVLGLTSIFSGVYYHYLSTVTESKIIAIPTTFAIQHIEHLNLWQETSKILCQAAQYYYMRDEVVSGSTVYEVIKNHLEILWRYPLEEREKISTFDFIMSRSNISRSSLNKVLKDLISGGYITMRRGRLYDIKKLPPSY